jgi:hypothetical protein
VLKVGKMNGKERLKALIETVYLAYKTALTEPPKPPRTPFTREDIQEHERQKALQVLDALKKRMGDA